MTKLSEDTKLSVLSEHYNNTVDGFKKLGKSREWNFTAILLLLVVMAFQYVSPDQSESVLTQLVQKQLGVDVSISIRVIGSLVWFALLYVAIRYFQSVINIEKQYNYTHQLEKELAKSYKGKAFTREGKAYLNNYAIFSDWVHIVYWYIFPALFLLAITAKIAGEWLVDASNLTSVLLNTLIYVSLFLSTILYVYSLHKTKKNTEKDLRQ
ncbi:MAG: hypothetical protein H6797_01250 [Candidatus Nomurabacteria bacterium]|nr:MAG: hypothetical protein H6797_01250 [Candidatus Nomurabacteria bacterium]